MHFYKSDDFYDRLLLEDCPAMDLSVEVLGIGDKEGELTCHPKHDCVLAGVEESAEIWKKCGVTVDFFVPNGSQGRKGEVCLKVRGKAAALHRGWKITQNLMEYMSGIATRTKTMLDNARRANPAVHVSVTRKNFPGAKVQCLEAAVCAGAKVHRLNLSDSVLFFDWHRIFLDGPDCVGVAPETTLAEFARRVPELKASLPERKLAAEVDSREDAVTLAKAGLEVIQCEKFALDVLAATVRDIRAANPTAVILAAGGVNADNAADYAATGVDVLVTTWPYFGKPADIKVLMKRVG